jgi:type II secretory pathway component PulK
MSRRRRSAGPEGGFALIAVLLVLAFVSIIGAEFAYSMRLEASAARAYKEMVIAGHLAESGLEQAVREIVADYGYVSVGDDKDPEVDADCPLVFYARDRSVIKRLPHKDVPLGGGRFSYCISDESARLNLNAARPDALGRLLETLGLEKQDRDGVLDSLADWRDANEEHRANGAESEDTYLLLSVPYRSKNANLDSVGELVQVKGVTTKLLEGGDGRPGLASLVTVKTPGQININTVGHDIARALGVSEAGWSDIEQARRAGPYNTVPPAYSGVGLAVTTQTFRVEAQGIIDGQVRARLTAVVQKRTDANGDGVAVLEWSGIR